VRLGEGEFTHGMLQPQAIARTLLVSTQFAEIARRHHADEIIAVATAATREAANQAEFLQQFQAETGVPLHVISGREEARLIYLGVSSGIHLGEQAAVFIDIGGGSTEISVGTQREYQFLDSLKLGAIRLTLEHLPHPDDCISLAQYARLRQHVRAIAVRTVQRLKPLPFELAFGSSGTIENLATVAMRAIQKRPAASESLYLPLADLQHVAKLLCGMPIEERRKVPGLNPERADIIIGGMAILHTLMEELGIGVITVSDRGLRDGLLVDYLSRMEHGARYSDLSVRARSVLQLGRTCSFDEPHAAQTARLALALYDSAREAGLHAYGDRERELLGWAAQLHDIGTFLSYTDHHQHGAYFIRHAELLGFDQREKDIMAAAVYFHRKALPRKRDPEIALLVPDDQQLVRVLCVLLRLAESLDRTHAGHITDARFHAPDAYHLELHVTATQDCALEIWSVRTHEKAVRKVLGRMLIVERA
jgi:exopolyphosphatase/guanosine-5'-triphosphate,3'-diphosphate pyrophosphatase